MRQSRKLVDGATYHVYFRTNRSEFTLTEEWVKEMFIEVVNRAKKKYGFTLQSLCIMSNHVHMVIRPLDPAGYVKWEEGKKDIANTPIKKPQKNQRPASQNPDRRILGGYSEDHSQVKFKASLSRIMQFILGVFAQKFNRKLEIHGHFWDDRFKSAILASLMRFLRAMEYIDQNPVVALLVTKAEEYDYGRLRLSSNGPPGLIDPIESTGQIIVLDISNKRDSKKNLAQTEDSIAEKLIAMKPGVQFTVSQ